MRPDLGGESEIERQLRQTVVGRRPNAPASLREFIRQVPDTAAPVAARGGFRPGGHDRQLGVRRASRRAQAAIGAAAVIVLAIAGGAALVSIRHDRTGPSTSPGATAAAFDFVTADWGWQNVAEPAPGAVARLADGFLGECVAAGLPAACTSKDGVRWTLPADSAVLAVEGSAPFEGWSVAHGPAGWVAAGTVHPGTWRSSDGIHWAAVALDLPGLQLESAQVQAVDGGFAMVAQVLDAGQTAYPGQQRTTKLLFSTDGAAWTPLDLAGMSQPQPAGASGLVAVKTGNSAGGAPASSVVASSDGRNWHALSLPDSVSSLSGSTRLADGNYVAVTTSAGGAAKLLISADGVTWVLGTGLDTWIDSLAVVGPHVLAISNIPSTAISALWESSDGATWKRVALLDGKPLSGTQIVALGDRVALFTGSKLTMVGVPLPPGYTPATAAPTSSSTPAASPSTAPAQALVVGGWRWHRIDLVPDDLSSYAVVRVPNGYFGRCGASMCTSPNGWSWQVPPDPAIFATDGAALFSPLSVAHGPGGGIVVNAAEGVWYSLDGVHWKPSPAPADPAGFRVVLYGSSGYTLVGSPDDAIGGKSRLYSSPDGASWTDLGIGPMVGLLARGDTSGGILDQTGKTPIGAAMGYSADGRTWVNATLPKGAYASNVAYRLADGSLIVQGGEGVLRSVDGRSWVTLKTGWQPTSMAVAGDRIVAVVNDTGTGGTAWESTDQGKTFQKLMAGVSSVAQFGDLVLVDAGGAAYVGAPLGPSEAPGTTPSATGLPGATPAPTPTPAPSPAGGISRDEALRIATSAVGATPDQVARVSVSAYLDSRYGRWIWRVSFVDQYGGNLGSSGRFVDIDFFTGEVLGSGFVIS